ncbi:MAG: hypothetical protein ABIC91_07350 [Nanoarchaeota archaeon]|nr:hypothetical protein [Nanoarchaeota archaeon]MBU1031219.1 hypothetical protein [Nanoarchaeota archaeon]MBU1849213.1 hypothetical protein [Nanoarchaeota archaeon]
MTFKDYVKSVWANKVTLAGYVALPISGFLLYHVIIVENTLLKEAGCALGALSLWMSCVGSLSTNFALGTKKSYQKAKKLIKQYGKLTSNYAENLEWYCDIQGTKLAVKEAGLEKTVEFNKPKYF